MIKTRCKYLWWSCHSGNYLMTVPQQLEPFSLEDNPALIAAVKNGKLPFCAEHG